MRNHSVKAALAFAVLGTILAGCQTTALSTNLENEKVAQTQINTKAVSDSKAPTYRVAEVQNADGEKLKCKTEVLTGSRLGSKEVCLTQEKWNAMRAENARLLQEITNHGAKNYK